MKKKEKGQKTGIVFVADHWREYTGGIDVFNEKLCEEMAYVVDCSEVSTICLIFGTMCTQYRNDYEEKGIYLVSYRTAEDEILDEAYYKRVRKEVVNAAPCAKYIWIGHDLQTGEKALKLSEIESEDECAVIFHTDYFSMHPERPDQIERREKKDDYENRCDRQMDLAQKVNWPFLVGPKLNKRFGKVKKAKQIIPGMDVNCRKECLGNYNQIMTSGRFDENTKSQKKWLEVCIGIGRTIDILADRELNTSYQVIVYGFSRDYSKEALEEMRKKAVKEIKEQTKNHINVNLDFRYFEKDRTKYLETLAKSNVFVMSSWMETFGLVAWEAVEMGIPIVVSENSGIYEYMKEELGYLLRGLCGSFSVVGKDPTQEMGKAILDILTSDKVKESAEELRKQMLKRNRWETLAIEIAKTIGIKNVMSADVFNDNACFEFVYASRKLFLDELKKRVQSKRIDNRVVFFDGISAENILNDSVFWGELLEMLCAEDKRNVEIFLGYPTEKAIAERISQIDKESVDVEKLKNKVKAIAQLKEEFKYNWENCVYRDYKFNKEEFKNAINRIHLIPLDKSPSVYINVLDDEWYFTVKYEKRSSDNATMKLQLENSADGMRQKKNLIEHMKFILSVSEQTEENKNMVKQLEKW